jgi:hypothetical protein
MVCINFVLVATSLPLELKIIRISCSPILLASTLTRILLSFPRRARLRRRLSLLHLFVVFKELLLLQLQECLLNLNLIDFLQLFLINSVFLKR